MNYLDIKAKLEVLLVKKRIRMTLLVMLPIIVVYGARIIGMLIATENDLVNYVISVVLSLIGVLISNLAYFCILRYVRGERVNMDIVQFSMKHLPIQIVLSIVYTFVRLFIDTSMSLVAGILPFIYLPLNLCLMILYFAVESTIAFCIYDGGVNVSEIARGCFQFIKEKARIIVRSGGAYLLSYFAYIIALASIVSNAVQIQDGVLDVERTIGYLIADPFSGMVISILGLTLIFWVLFAYFEMRVFAATALLYDENKPLYFSRMKNKNTR